MRISKHCCKVLDSRNFFEKYFKKAILRFYSLFLCIYIALLKTAGGWEYSESFNCSEVSTWAITRLSKQGKSQIQIRIIKILSPFLPVRVILERKKNYKVDTYNMFFERTFKIRFSVMEYFSRVETMFWRCISISPLINCLILNISVRLEIFGVHAVCLGSKWN